VQVKKRSIQSPLGIVIEDLLAPVTARGDVVQSVLKVDADRTRQRTKDYTDNGAFLDSIGSLVSLIPESG